MIELECSGEKLSILGRVLQRNKTKRLYIYVRGGRGDVCVYVKIYDDKLPHMTREARKSHNLPSPS